MQTVVAAMEVRLSQYGVLEVGEALWNDEAMSWPRKAADGAEKRTEG